MVAYGSPLSLQRQNKSVTTGEFRGRDVDLIAPPRHFGAINQLPTIVVSASSRPRLIRGSCYDVKKTGDDRRPAHR